MSTKTQITNKQKFVARIEQLKDERSGYIDLWRELADNVLYNRGAFLTSKKRNPVRNTKQFNNTPKMAARTLGSGMMAGITSPARPWFKLSTSDPRLADVVAVRQWLHDVEKIIYRIFAASNTYNMLHQLYSELGVFANGSMGVFEDAQNIIRCQTFTIGSYMLGTGAYDRINTFGREYEKTVSEVVSEFGIENVSDSVKDNWYQGNLNSRVTCYHLIEPNDDRDRVIDSPFSRDMAYRSVYWENGNDYQNSFLRESGFNEFPILTPRWDVTGDSIYSDSCPGMDAIGDCKALQLGERRYYQALDKVANPPMQGDSSLRSTVGDGVPRSGEMIWHSQTSKGIGSIYENFNPRLDQIFANQKEVETRINKAYYVDLFLMLANTDRRQITAREVAEKHEEKLLMLGPVLERLHTELLDKLIDRTFNIAQRNNMLPPPPPELVNGQVSVDYVSILAQAQRMIGLTNIERTVGFAIELSNMWPQARHKIDPMHAVDRYADDIGVDPKLIRSSDDASKIAAAEAQQQQEQQALANTGQAAANAQSIAQSQQTQAQTAQQMRDAGLM